MAIIALFRFFNGYAHGLEMSGAFDAEAYALHFLAATIAFHLAGIVVGIATRTRFVRLPQTLGAIITACGLCVHSALCKGSVFR